MDKMGHLMAEKSKNNKKSQKGQITPKNIFLKVWPKAFFVLEV
jgi:hypothetical protein